MSATSYQCTDCGVPAERNGVHARLGHAVVSVPAPFTQQELDELATELREIGYPYIGQAEYNAWVLLPDGTVRSVWDGEPAEDDTISTMEEIRESIYCWANDC